MTRLLIEKELLTILKSPKFFVTFLCCSILIILSFYIGIQEYENSVKQYEANQNIADQNLQDETAWMQLSTLIHRKPNPMQIFVSGVHYDIGRKSAISNWQEAKLERSPYSDEPLFAIFRHIDFVFIVQVVLSLFAILFTYDAVNGEREDGTLKLTISNSVSRAHLLLSKYAGRWLALVIPLAIPVSLGILMVLYSGITFSTTQVYSILGLMGLSLLYLTFFIGLGLLISTLTQKSSSSFLLLLVIWLVAVLIIPRAGVMTAGTLVPVESTAQLESKMAAYAGVRWEEYSDEVSKLWERRNAEMAGMDQEERKAYRDENEWEWLEEEDALRKQVRADITEYNRKILEEALNRQKQLEKLAFQLSRISPVSSFQLAASNFAATDIDLKSRYESTMREYRQNFRDYVEKKKEESGQQSGFRISISTENGIKMDMGRDSDKLQIDDMPIYHAPEKSFREAFSAGIMDIGLLGFYCIFLFASAFIAFIRYDVR